MHEIGIIQATLSAALDYAQARGARQIYRLQLQIGELSGVNPDALAFAFDVVGSDTLADKAEPELISVPATCYCSSCQQTFQPLGWVYECPCCYQLRTEMRQDRILELSYLELSSGETMYG